MVEGPSSQVESNGPTVAFKEVHKIASVGLHARLSQIGFVAEGHPIGVQERAVQLLLGADETVGQRGVSRGLRDAENEAGCAGRVGRSGGGSGKRDIRADKESVLDAQWRRAAILVRQTDEIA